MRCITAAPPDNRRGSIALNERRPWEPEPPLSSITVDFDLTGPEEEGLSRVERRSLLEAA
jgi:hypothetical protein